MTEPEDTTKTRIKYLLFLGSQVGLILVTIITLWSCNSSKSVDKGPINNLIKEQVVTDFKTEMIMLCDSSNFYFDIALTEIAIGNNLSDISEKVIPKLKSFEKQLDMCSKAFSLKAKSAGLNQQEFDKVYEDLTNFTQPLLDKYNQLKDKGIEFK